jgi:hypothetical protein
MNAEAATTAPQNLVDYTLRDLLSLVALLLTELASSVAHFLLGLLTLVSILYFLIFRRSHLETYHHIPSRHQSGTGGRLRKSA